MSDRALREAERRWRTSGSSDDEAVYLLERVRTGELTEKRLKLLACLGHPAAKIATCDDGYIFVNFVTQACEGVEAASDDEAEARIIVATVVRAWYRQSKRIKDQSHDLVRDAALMRLCAFQLSSCVHFVADGRYAIAIDQALVIMSVLLEQPAFTAPVTPSPPRPKLRRILEELRNAMGETAHVLLEGVRQDTIRWLTEGYDILAAWNAHDTSQWPYVVERGEFLPYF